MDGEDGGMHIPMGALGGSIGDVGDFGDAGDVVENILDAGKLARRVWKKFRPKKQKAAAPGAEGAPPATTHAQGPNQQYSSSSFTTAPNPHIMGKQPQASHEQSMSPYIMEANRQMALQQAQASHEQSMSPYIMEANRQMALQQGPALHEQSMSPYTPVPDAGVMQQQQQHHHHHHHQQQQQQQQQAPLPERNPPSQVRYSSCSAAFNLVWGLLGLCCLSPIAIAAVVFASMAISTGARDAPKANGYASRSLALNIVNFVIVLGVAAAIYFFVIRADDDDDNDFL